MKILVMSDTHGDANVIKQVQQYYPNIKITIHCGDSELASNHEALSSMIVAVRGNCDRDEAFPIESFVQLDNVKVYTTHGHVFDVKSTPLKLLYRAKEVEADLVFYGHSHRLAAEMIDGTLFINPGSLLKPRGRKEKSFAIVERNLNNWHVTFYTDANEKISSHIFPIPIK